MYKCAFVSLLAWSSTTLGTAVDEYFAEGALGVRWGATLEQVLEAFPGGLSYPLAESETDADTIPVMYVVDPRVSLPGLRTPCGSVAFLFTRSVQLKRIACYYPFSDRDSVLYEIAELLGQDYLTRDDSKGRTYSWRNGQGATVGLRIGSIAPFEWVVLTVCPIPREKTNSK